jgi:hypothetical protein
MFSNESVLPTPSPVAIFQRLDDGAVLFSTQEEVYFGVNAVGARIWELLPPSCDTFGELCATLAVQYPGVPERQIRADAQAFLADLLQSGLAIPVDDAQHAAVSRQGAA